MKRCVAIFLVILSALLLGLSTQSGALNGEFAWQPKSPVLLPEADVANIAESETTQPGTGSSGAKDVGARGLGGEVAAMRQFLREVCEVNQLPVAKNHSYRDLPLELRERLFWALFRAEQSLSLPKLQKARREDLRPNCKHPNLLHLLTGKKRQRPLTLIDMPTGMGGGPELDFLELRMLELQGVADIMVVAESSYTFRGDRKPRHYQLNAERFQAFHDRVLYMDLEQCDKYWLGVNDVREKHGQRRAFWAIEGRQRGCLWTMLERYRPNLTDDAIVIFTDLDEIPNGELMMAMKHCEWKAWNPKIFLQFRQRVVTFNLRQVLSNRPGCFPKDAWRQGALVGLGRARATFEKNQSIPLRMKGSVHTIDGGAMHLSHFGNAFAVMTKGLQHGEGGGLLLPGWIKPCDAGDQDILELLSIFRNDPIRIVRSWENRSKPLPKARPTLKDLQNCEVPWALQSNPRRYAAFWGEDPPNE